jgi:glycyl-tRNA synthetase
LEYFVRLHEWEKSFTMWFELMKSWLMSLGVRESDLIFREIAQGERAHYSERTVDIEYNYPFGQKELYGLAYRTDYDLKQHAKFSGADLTYLDQETGSHPMWSSHRWDWKGQYW